MTCIVGIVQPDGSIVMGGDSAGVSGLDVTVRKDPKVFVLRNEFVIGFTHSFRLGDLLKYRFNPPPLKDDLDRYMAVDFVDALRDTYRDGGALRRHDDIETAGVFLVGVRGRLFRIDSDFQVGEAWTEYVSVGCGEAYALGSLFATPDVPAPQRVEQALWAAVYFSGGVRPPFTVATLPFAE